MRGGTIKECINSGDIKGMDSKVGGISGEAKSSVIITNCINTGNVEGKEAVGGIAAAIYSGTVEKSYNTGNITGTLRSIGGICGGVGDDGTGTAKIQSTYNTGIVKAESGVTDGVGGIIGLVSSNALATISNNYNRGDITIEDTETTDIGGVIGYIDIVENVCEAKNNYYLDTVVTERGSNTSGDSRGVEHMKSQAFVDELNTELTEKAWVKTSGYPALIGM